jgi:hypothetical protein
VIGNDLSDNGDFELIVGHGYIGTADGVNLIGNVANSCAASGILLFGNENLSPAQRNTVRDNTTLDNGRAGTAAVGATEATRPYDNLFQSNTAFGNNVSFPVEWDLDEGVVGSGSPPGDCLNTWVDNDFGFAGVDCIE